VINSDQGRAATSMHMSRDPVNARGRRRSIGEDKASGSPVP